MIMFSSKVMEIFAFIGTTLLFSGVADAAVACTQTALVQAVKDANAAGGGTITLTPGCTYTLTSANGNDGTNGPTGLPIITTPITFSGNNNTITRSLTAPYFRIMQVTLTGGLTLNGVTLSGGSTTSNGGGIYSAGAVTMTASALLNNSAVGMGGALYSTGTPSASTLTNTKVQFNFALQGAGLAINKATLTTTSSTVANNIAITIPGGIYFLAGTATLTSTTITANTPTNCVGSPSPVPGCIG